MATIFIDNELYEVKDGQNLLEACLSLGFNLPYFCWHPAMGSVGACRQCAVKQFRSKEDARGKLIMACMTPGAEGTRISIEDPEAREFRASITEWMMVNHPHDCPVCDEGGECHLQDMVVMTGHDYRRYGGKKRTFRNQNLGPFVTHEINRCIQCYRCVRFYRDYAGGRDFDVFMLRKDVYFGRAQDGVLESEFSGNLVEVCPTGVFDDKTLTHHYTRKWDLRAAPSICVHCGLGCNTIPGERYGMLRRIRNRYNGQVNGYFLCDRGRYGYEFVNSDRRIRFVQVRGDSNHAALDLETATPSEQVAIDAEGFAAPGFAQHSPRRDLLSRAESSGKEQTLQHLGTLLSSNRKMLGIGSPRASLEANFALRTLVGPERFYAGTSAQEYRLICSILATLQNGPARTPSLRDVQLADAVFVLGEDVTNVTPMLALALRQSVRRKPMQIAEKLRIPEWDDHAVREAVQDKKGPLFIASVNSTRLDDIATQTYRAAHDDLARLGFAVAHVLDNQSPTVDGLSDEISSLASSIAQALKEAERPLVVSGTSSGSEAIIHAAANVAWALCTDERAAELCFTVPECNSIGLALMGGENIEAAFRAAQGGDADTVIILENDLYRRAEADAVGRFLETAKQAIVIDHLTNPTEAKAKAVLPAATFAESDGTLVNNEGRAQHFFQVFVPGGDIQESWRWLRDLMLAMGRTEIKEWQTLDDITAALTEALPVFRAIPQIAPPANFRIAAQKIAREPHRDSGRTAMYANISVHEPKPPDDPDTPFSFSMEGYAGEQIPSSLIPRFWAPGWNSVQAVNKFQGEVGGPLHGGDPGRRLIEPAQVQKVSYFRDVPAAFKPRKGEWQIVALYHVLGSEELSILTSGIARLAPQPYLALNPADANGLRVKEGEEIQLVFDGVARRLPVRSMPMLPRGVAGLPAGLPGLAGISLPAWSELVPIEKV